MTIGHYFSVYIARCQERGSTVSKHGRTEKPKRKYTSLFIKYLRTAFLKANIHCNGIPCPGKVKSLESEAIAKLNNICTGNITLGHPTDFANSIGT